MADTGADPLATLREARERARSLADPSANVCTLATVDAAGHPQARTLVLREVDGRLAVFGNETSPKWRELETSPSLAVLIWLPSIELQYRLRCTSSPIDKAVVHASWQLRPPAPKQLDWFYTRVQPQSSMVSDRAALLAGLQALTLDEPLVAPATAAGVFLEPQLVERLDLATGDGVHDRRRYRRSAAGWSEETLVP